MIGLDPVVEVLRRPVLDRVFQLARPFQSAHGLRIGTKLVGGDRHRRPVAHDLQCLGQKAACRLGVPAVGQHEIDQASLLVDDPEQVFSLATHPDVGLVRRPIALVPADPLLELRRVALDPAVERHVVDGDAAFAHHFLKVPVADAVAAVPADAEQDDLGRKPAALEHRYQGEVAPKTRLLAAQPG
jgi:hypothetical protein